MTYPVWHLAGVNSGLIVAVVSVLHVFVAQFAVAGVSGWSGWNAGSGGKMTLICCSGWSGTPGSFCF